MIALDTNVLIYASDRTSGRKHELAPDLIKRSKDGVVLWQVGCEFVALFRKLSGQGLKSNEAWRFLREYLDLFPPVLPRPAVLDHARELHLGQQ